ncbi:hypothetical protein D3C77_639090 [compost metagenome]
MANECLPEVHMKAVFKPEERRCIAGAGSAERNVHQVLQFALKRRWSGLECGVASRRQCITHAFKQLRPVQAKVFQQVAVILVQ